MRCTVTGDPYTVFGYDGKQVRDNIHCDDVVRAFEAFHRAPRAGAGLQPRRRARVELLDARGDRRLRADRGQHARLDATPTRRGWATTAGGSATSARSRPTIPEWELQLRPRDDAARDPRRQRRALERRHAVKLSVVIPAHNEALVIEPTLRGLIDVLDAGRSTTTRSSSSTTRRPTGPADVVRAPSASRACAACVNDGPHGFGFAVRAGWSASRATRS